jgi:hypothetical protein
MIKDSLPVAVGVGIAIGIYVRLTAKSDGLHEGLVAAGVAFAAAMAWDVFSTLVFRRRR